MAVNKSNTNVSASRGNIKVSRINDPISVSRSIIVGGSGTVFAGTSAGASPNIGSFSISKGSSTPNSNNTTYSLDFIKSNET